MDKGLPAKLIQTNEKFNLFDLLEIRYFIESLDFSPGKYTISDDTWKSAKKKLWDKYKESEKIDICINLIKDFELSNPKRKYRSDFEIFIRESKLEDFINADVETVLVSTIHKAKGKEFDNVILMLDGFNPDNDERKRVLYVAMTRAKNNLSIHLNGSYLDDISSEKIERKNDNFKYKPSNLLISQLTHKDIFLNYFILKQDAIAKLKGGDRLIITNDGCSDESGKSILKFSNSYKQIIAEFESRGYKPAEGKINYILYWQKEELENEILIVLPELRFLKKI